MWWLTPYLPAFGRHNHDLIIRLLYPLCTRGRRLILQYLLVVLRKALSERRREHILQFLFACAADKNQGGKASSYSNIRVVSSTPYMRPSYRHICALGHG